MYSRYKKLLNDKNISNYKVSKDTGITQTTLSDWKNGKITPKTDTLQKIADYFGVTLDYLIGNSDFETKEEMFAHWKDEYNKDSKLSEEIKKIKKGIRIPVLGKVAAGIPIEAIENIEEYEEISETMARKGEYFALKIQGESMEPKFSEGDVVIIKKQDDIESGEIGVVIVNGCDATVKKVIKQQEGILLIAMNQSVYQPKFYDNKSIEDLPVKILGKVVELRAKF